MPPATIRYRPGRSRPPVHRASRCPGKAWAISDRLSVKYTGQPYPLRTGRVVFLVEPDHARARIYG